MRLVRFREIKPLPLFLFSCLLLACTWSEASAQYNHLRYDVRRFNLGFLMGVNVSDVKMYYHELEYTRRHPQGLRDIRAEAEAGITLGMISNLKLHNNIDLRFIPAVSLQQRTFRYYIQDTVRTRKLEASYIDLPLLIKFKSNFYAHHRVYVATGAKVSINMVSNKRVDNDPDLIKIDRTDLSWEFAFGVDIYGERVKLCPEIRYSLGLKDIYIPKNTNYGSAIRMLTSQSIMFCLNFE